MPLSEEQRQEILDELRVTRAMLADIPDRLEALEDKNKHTRWFAYFLAVALVFGLGYVLWDRYETISDYQKQGCEVGNESRGAEHQLWDTLFAEDKQLAEQMGEKISKEEQEALDRIAALVDKAYPQRDCTKVKSGQIVNVTPSPTGGPND